MSLFAPPYPPSYTTRSFPDNLAVLGGVPCLVLPAEGGVGGCFTVVYAHANAVDVGQITMMMKNLQLYCAREARLPVHVVAVEYPGYGVHKGSPTEASIDGAMARAAAALIGYGWPRERIVIFGRSIGTGPAVTLATELRPAALALVAPFTSMREVTGHIAALLTRLPLGVAHALGTLAVSDWWRSVDRAPRVMCPTLFIHGCTDRIVPCGHSIKLFRRLRAERGATADLVLVPGMDHNFGTFSWEQVCSVFARFIQRQLGELPASRRAPRPLGLPREVFREAVAALPEIAGPDDVDYQSVCLPQFALAYSRAVSEASTASAVAAGASLDDGGAEPPSSSCASSGASASSSPSYSPFALSALSVKSVSSRLPAASQSLQSASSVASSSKPSPPARGQNGGRGAAVEGRLPDPIADGYHEALIAERVNPLALQLVHEALMIALASHAAQAAAAATAEGGDASSPSPPPSQLASATSSSSSWRNRLSLSAIGGSLGGALIGGGGARHLPASAAGWLLVRRHGAPGSGRKQHASWGQQFVVLLGTTLFFFPRGSARPTVVAPLVRVRCEPPSSGAPPGGGVAARVPPIGGAPPSAIERSERERERTAAAAAPSLALFGARVVHPPSVEQVAEHS